MFLPDAIPSKLPVVGWPNGKTACLAYNRGMSAVENETSSLLVVIATFNERQSLPLLVDELLKLLPTCDIHVVDDNSPDGTGAWCDQRASEEDRLTVSHRTGKLGLGSATKLGLRHGITGGYQFIATMDADLSHDAKSLQEMYLKYCHMSAEPSAVVIGSRYVKGGQIIGWPWYRRLSSWGVNAFARFALRLRTRDNTSAFRIYPVVVLEQIDLDDISSQGYSYLEEILVLLRKSNVRMEEYPITFRNREVGQSKVDISEMVRSLWQILRLAFR